MSQGSQHFRNFYTLHEELGRGSFAVVHRCHHNTSHDQFAVKIIDKSKATASQLSDIQSETELMQKIQHQHIIRLNEIMNTHNTMYLIMELVRGGDLFKLIARITSYSETVCATLMRHTLQAIEYLHDRGIAHRDLKPDNMLLTHALPKSKTELAERTDLLTDVKIADFGFATMAKEDTLTKCCGTPYYIAPEILNCGLYKTGGPYGRQCDMWSLGVITYVLLCGFPPFQAQKRNQLFKIIVKGKVTFPPNTVWDNVSDTAKSFIKKLLVTDPKKRLTPHEAQQHPWIAAHTQQPNVHLTGTQAKLALFNGKQKFRGAVFGVEAAHRLLYIQKCLEVGCKPNSGVTAAMENHTGADESDEIDLSNNYVGKKGVEALMGMIQTKTKLKKLILRANEVENTSVDTIVKTLSRHPSITHIDLAKNPLSRTAAKKIIHLVQVNQNIQRVDLEGTDIHPAKIKIIDGLLGNNRTAMNAAKAALQKQDQVAAANHPAAAQKYAMK